MTGEGLARAGVGGSALLDDLSPENFPKRPPFFGAASTGGAMRTVRLACDGLPS